MVFHPEMTWRIPAAVLLLGLALLFPAAGANIDLLGPHAFSAHVMVTPSSLQAILHYDPTARLMALISEEHKTVTNFFQVNCSCSSFRELLRLFQLNLQINLFSVPIKITKQCNLGNSVFVVCGWVVQRSRGRGRNAEVLGGQLLPALS